MKLKYFINDFHGDCLILTNYIEDLEFYDNKRRKHLNNKKGATWSMLYGLTPYKAYKKGFDRVKDPDSKYYWSKGRMENPHLQDVFKEFGNLYFPDFDWRSVMINKNFECKPHLDKGNVGVSVMIGLGDYSKGELFVKNSETNKVKKLETWHTIIRFDGSKHLHWTNEFTGNRFTLVFYNNINF